MADLDVKTLTRNAFSVSFTSKTTDAENFTLSWRLADLRVAARESPSKEIRFSIGEL